MPQSALVHQLNRDRIDWRGEFRIIRKYTNPSYGHVPETVELCLMDREGGRIQATVNNFLISKFDDYLREGDLVSITQFSVVDNVRTFPMADSMYKIMFQKMTFVHSIVRRTFPSTLFQFKRFSDIISGGHKDDNPLFDIIGEIIDMKESKVKGDGVSLRNQFVELLLADLDGNKLPCLLWEPYCEQFRGLSDFLRSGQRKQCVMIVQLCRTRMFKGGLGVSNTYHATKVYFRVDLDEIVEFRSKLPSNDMSRSFDGSQFSYDQTLSAKEELENPSTIVMSIDKLKDAEVAMRVWIVGSISEVIYDWDWCYTSCSQCKRKVVEKDSRVFCSNCKSYVVYNTRYKIHVRVVDGTGCVTLLLWNDIAHEMIGELASSVAEKCVVEKYPKGDVEIITRDVRKLAKPEPIQDLVGRGFLFKISVEQKHILGKDDVYHVEKVSEDEELKKKYQKTDHGVPVLGSICNKSSVGDTNSVPAEIEPSEDSFFSPHPVSVKKKIHCGSYDGGSTTSTKTSKRKLRVTEDDDQHENDNSKRKLMVTEEDNEEEKKDNGDNCGEDVLNGD